MERKFVTRVVNVSLPGASFTVDLFLESFNKVPKLGVLNVSALTTNIENEYNIIHAVEKSYIREIFLFLFLFFF